MQQRTKLMSLTSGTLIVYELPATVEITKVVLKADTKGAPELTDGDTFHMDLSE